MREIGSEFWKPNKQHIRNNESIYLSGRTALDVIIKDAVKSYCITSALLPSYCCHTMIEPFLINGIHVRFYDVYVRDNDLVADIPSPKENEILYIMKYFGDTDIQYEGKGKYLSGWETSVEDLTHSCFTAGYSTQATYWFTSYRKWFAVEGIAVAGKRNGKLPEALRGRNEAHYKLRNEAFSLKQQFMDGKPVKKQKLLDTFGEAEIFLSENYSGYGAGLEEVHSLFQFMDGIENVHRRRRDNARLLMEGLDKIAGIKVFVDFRDDKKCPMFVPITVKDWKRDSLRQWLISKDIYCPVHWPLSVLHKGISERAKKIYDEDLSLVCDQRYDAMDMERTIREVNIFMN